MAYIIRLNNKTMEFLTDVRGEFTVKDARHYMFAGYHFLSALRDAKLIRLKGVKGNNERIWVLTKKGKELAECLRTARNIIED
ncbi:MAG: hypothetical protein DRN81_02075 [Thermoproteota archaeon]|nr:MAG: hypothetical protein DRN81_02075 [Candidatus Korarchaeota archaeon]